MASEGACKPLSEESRVPLKGYPNRAVAAWQPSQADHEINQPLDA
jgi:hypothetical protein